MSDERKIQELKNEGTSLISRMALNDNKAGMQGVNKEKINQIIMENTVGSRYYKNEQKRDAQVKERIEKMKNRLLMFTVADKSKALQKANLMIEEIEKERDLSKTILHIDMDAFYASVEERDQPELKTKPMAVGGMDMLSTSNYVARKFGVRAAMPGFIAMKLCPDMIIVPLNFTKYKSVSKEIQQIYQRYDENFMAAGLDEAYIDITEHLQSRLLTTEAERTFDYNPELLNQVESGCDSFKSKTFGFSAEEVAEEIRFCIYQTTKLTASAGIAPNLMLAKIGSDLNKPNGQARIPHCRESVIDFMKTLPLRKVSGIGKVSEQLLTALDIKTCGDLIEKRANLILLFSAVSSSFFIRAGLGCSSNHVGHEGERKSISTERTFNAISNEPQLFSKLQELCQALSEDMLRSGVQGKTVTLKIKTINFELHTRSRSCPALLSTSVEIFNVAKDLLKQEIQQSATMLSLRLMGVGMSKLESSESKSSNIKRFFTKSEAKQIETSEQNPTSKNKMNLKEEKPTCSRLERDDNNSSTIHKNRNCFKDQVSTNEDIIKNEPNLKFTCPVCCLNFPQLLDLNEHLDDCLVNKKPSIADKVQPSNDETPDPCDFSNQYQCPLCFVVFSPSDMSLDLFNKHIDSCLNRKAIKEILKNDVSEKNSRITENRNKTNTRVSVKDSHKHSKRRKVFPKSVNTIDKFLI